MAMMQNVVWIISFLSYQSSLAGEDCLKSGNNSKCSADFFMKEGKCTPCPDGYFGPNCMFKCPYPSYGRRCLEGKCDCLEDLCKPETGCFSQPITQNNLNKTSFRKGTFTEVNNVISTEQQNKDSGGSKESASSSTVVVMISVFCTLIIISLVVVIVLQMKGKLKAHNQILSSYRRSRVVSHRHVDTYCEIDEKNMEKTECNECSEAEIYELIDKSNKSDIKYTELPTRKGVVSYQERKLMPTISVKKILDDDNGGDDINLDNQHHAHGDQKYVNSNESKVKMRKDKVDLETFSKRNGKTSSNISGYIDMEKRYPTDYVSMNAENFEP